MGFWNHSAVKLLVLLAGVYLLITFFGLPDYLAINSSPINTLNFRKSEPLSNFDNKIKQLQEQSQQILKKPDQNEHNIVHENELAVYDTNNDAENGGNQPQKSIIHQTCNNYSKNANSNPQKQRLFFLKTHKTGSSTLQAIFFRKALASGKSVMLPREDGKHTFEYPTPFAGYLSDDKCYTQKKCHFLSSHTVFGPKALTAFPKEETSYISVVRGVDTGMYRSLFRYCHNGVDAYKDLPNNIEGFAQFAADPWKFYNETYETPKNKRDLLWFFGRNAVMYDLGFPEFSDSRESAESEERINEVVRIIMERFDFMILTDKMDESLVLMADMLCWSLDDIIEFRQNIELNKDDTSIITDQMMENLRKFNKADHALYLASVKRFEELKEAFGAQRLKDQVDLLKLKRENLIQECTVGGKPVGASQLRDPYHNILNPPGITIGGWKLNKHGEQTELCRDLVSDELTWTDKVRRYMMRKGHIYHKRPKPKSVQQQLLAKAQAKIKAREKNHLKGNGVRRRRHITEGENFSEATEVHMHMDVELKPKIKSGEQKSVRDQLKRDAMRSQLRR